MNVVAFANLGLAGFLVSLMVLDCLRAVIRVEWPVQAEGLQLETRLMPWVLALLAGPALLWDRSAPCRRGEEGGLANLIILLAILTLWSASYGASLAFIVRMAVPHLS